MQSKRHDGTERFTTAAYAALAALSFSLFSAGCGVPENEVYETDDTGQIQEGLILQTPYGIFLSNTEECLGPWADPERCLLPTDKKMRPKWVGPETDPSVPNVNFRNLFSQAVGAFCSDANAHGWDCAETTGSSNESFKIGPIIGCNLGKTIPTLDAGTVKTTGGPVRKFNHCTSSISAENFAICSHPSPVGIRNVIYHELAHCAGFGHNDVPQNVMNGEGLQSTTVILRLNATQLNVMSAYQP